jgi:hypothetical protein
MIRCIVYLLWIFKMFHGRMNNPIHIYLFIYIQKLTNLHSSTQKMEAVCIFEMSETSPTSDDNNRIFFLICILGGGVQLVPLGTATTNRPIVPAPGDDDDGEIGEMMIGKGNLSTRRKPAPMPRCPPQTPHASLTRTRAAAVGSQRLTAWATARPCNNPNIDSTPGNSGF